MCRKNNGTIYRYKRLPLLVLQYNDYWFEYILKKGNTFLLDKIIFYDSISWLSQKIHYSSRVCPDNDNKWTENLNILGYFSAENLLDGCYYKAFDLQLTLWRTGVLKMISLCYQLEHLNIIKHINIPWRILHVALTFIIY